MPFADDGLLAMQRIVHRFVHHVNRFPSKTVHTLARFLSTLCGVKGYGPLIARAREARGKDVKALARDLGQSVSTVRRLESEETEPDVEQINLLVSNLPLSAEHLLAEMGLKLTLPVVARVPLELAQLMAAMSLEQQEGMIRFVRDLVAIEKARR